MPRGFNKTYLGDLPKHAAGTPEAVRALFKHVVASISKNAASISKNAAGSRSGYLFIKGEKLSKCIRLCRKLTFLDPSWRALRVLSRPIVGTQLTKDELMFGLYSFSYELRYYFLPDNFFRICLQFFTQYAEIVL